MNEFTVSEAANQLQVSGDTVRRWIAAGRLPARRAGRIWLVRQSGVDQLKRNGTAKKNGAQSAPDEPGTVGALLTAMERFWAAVPPEDVIEMERIIEAGCEQIPVVPPDSA